MAKITGYLSQGRRVAIRHVCRQDYDELTALAQDSAEMLHRWLGARDNTVEAFESHLERFEQSTHVGFVICLRDTGAIVGGVNINNVVRGALRNPAAFQFSAATFRRMPAEAAGCSRTHATNSSVASTTASKRTERNRSKACCAPGSSA